MECDTALGSKSSKHPCRASSCHPVLLIRLASCTASLGTARLAIPARYLLLRLPAAAHRCSPPVPWATHRPTANPQQGHGRKRCFSPCFAARCRTSRCGGCCFSRRPSPLLRRLFSILPGRCHHDPNTACAEHHWEPSKSWELAPTHRPTANRSPGRFGQVCVVSLDRLEPRPRCPSLRLVVSLSNRLSWLAAPDPDTAWTRHSSPRAPFAPWRVPVARPARHSLNPQRRFAFPPRPAKRALLPSKPGLTKTPPQRHARLWNPTSPLPWPTTTRTTAKSPPRVEPERMYTRPVRPSSRSTPPGRGYPPATALDA